MPPGFSFLLDSVMGGLYDNICFEKKQPKKPEKKPKSKESVKRKIKANRNELPMKP